MRPPSATAGTTPTRSFCRRSRGDSAVHLSTGALPEALSPKVCRTGNADTDCQTGKSAQLGGASSPQGPPIQVRQPGPADAATVAQHHPAAGPAICRRAQSLLSPGRRDGTPVALHRPGDPHPSQLQADPGQGRRRRSRPPVAPHLFQQLHLPQGERGSQQLHDAAVAHREGCALRPLPQPQRQRSGLAQAGARRAFPARAFTRHRSNAHQPGALFRARHRGQQHRPSR